MANLNNENTINFTNGFVSNLVKKQYGVQIDADKSELEVYLSWYMGFVPTFHKYNVYNGQQFVTLQKTGLHMAKKICEDWASLILNERCDISLPKGAKDTLDLVLKNTHFWRKGSEGIEKAFALGYGAFVGEYLNKNGGEIGIHFVDALNCFPLKKTKGKVIDCAFVSDDTVVVHRFDETTNTYWIDSFILDKNKKVVSKNSFNTKSDIPWFQMIHPNIVNNIYLSRNVGLSVFANSIDTLKHVDNIYDGFDIEFRYGRKKLFVAQQAWKIDPDNDNGELKPTFDPSDTLIYSLPENDDGKSLITEQGGELRHQSYIDSLNFELAMLTSKCGMGENYYRFDSKTGVTTATQVISENSSLFRTLKKHEIVVEEVLIGLTKMVIYIGNTFTTNYKFGEIDDGDIKILFDDSIIEDKQAEKENDRKDVQMGAMTLEQFVEKWYAMTREDVVKENYIPIVSQRVRLLLPVLQSRVLTNEMFIDAIFKDIKLKEEQKKEILAILEIEPLDPVNSDGSEYE